MNDTIRADRKWNDNREMLIKILESFCPTDDDDYAWIKLEEVKIMYRTSSKGLSSHDMTKGLTGCIWDGLAYGNWPWTK